MPKFLNNIDLNKNELQNAVIHVSSSDPGSPSRGQIFYDSSTNIEQLKVWNGSEWQGLATEVADTNNIFNTALKVGYDSTSLIDFTTDDTVTIRVDNKDSLAFTYANLAITNTTTSSATEGSTIQLICDDAALMGDDHRLGGIEFKAAEDGSNTLVVGAMIESFADAAWSDSENGARLVFSTTDGDASTTKALTLDSNGDAIFHTKGTAAHVGLKWDANGETEGRLVGGADDHGVDFIFYGETSGNHVTWDMSADALVLSATSKLYFHDQGGENIVASSDGHLEINAGTTLDITAPTVDINSSTEIQFDTAAFDVNATGMVYMDSVGLSIDNAGTAANITSTSDAAGEDFTIALAGATDSSLILSSTGTGVDALQITTTAGGIDITNGGASGEDIDIDGVLSAVNINSDESAADAIKITATLGGIDILASGAAAGEDIDIIATGSSVNIKSTENVSSAIVLDATVGGIDILASGAGAGEDIDITATGSSVNITSTENVANAIYLRANGGTGETIKIHSDQGSGAGSIELTSDAGGIDLNASGAISLDSSAGSIDINVVDGQTVKLGLNGGVEQTIAPSSAAGSELYSVINTAGTTDGTDAAGAILLSSVAGGIGLAWADGKDLWAEGGRAVITANQNEAAAIKLHADAGASQTIDLINDAGTSESAIQLTSTAGGIDLNAASGKDITLDAGQVVMTAQHNVASAIKLHADAGASQTIVAINDAGTSESAITLTSTAGGIDLNAAAGKDITLDAGQVILTGTHNTANTVHLHANGGTSETIKIHSDQGTSVTEGSASIQLLSDAGGINIKSTANLANAILLTADGGTSETIKIHSDQGTGAASIELVSDVGGITLTGDTDHGVLVGTVSGGPVSIGHSTSETTVNHNLTVTGTLTATGGLTDNSGVLTILDDTASATNTGGKLVLASNDGAAFGDTHRLGVIEFQAAEDDSNNMVTGARIEATAEATWSATENGTALEFYTTDVDAVEGIALTLDSDQKASFASHVAIAGNLTVAGTTTTENTTIIESTVSVLQFEGTTDNAHETIFKVAEPIADTTFSLPAIAAGDYFIAALADAATAASCAVTATEFALLDGDSSIGTTSVSAGHGIHMNHGGSMAHTSVDTLDTYFSATTKTLTNKTLTSPVLTTPTVTTSIVPTTANSATLGTATKEWGDLFLGDGGVIKLGSDQDVTLTHVADAGITLNSAMKLHFGDTGTYIHQSANGVLDLVSDNELELNATTVDLNGNLDVSGTGLVTGVLTTTAEQVSTGGMAVATNSKVKFRDSALYIYSSADGQLDIAADTEVQIDTATVDLNGNLDVSGTGLVTGVLTTTAEQVSSGGMSVATNKKVQFRDAAIYINSSADGQLDIVADTEVQIATAKLDLNGNLDVSGTALVTGVLTTTAQQISSGGIQLATDKKLEFRDSAVYINSDADGYLEAVADTGISLKIGSTEQVILTDGVFKPTTDSDVDLGTSSVFWKDAFIDKITTTGVIELGHANDTTVAKSAAGIIKVQAFDVPLAKSFVLDHDVDGVAAAVDGETDSTTFTITHLFPATYLVKVEILTNSGNYDTVFADVTRPTNGTVLITFATAVANGAYVALLTRVG
jgi:hypothetical protein